MSVLRIIEIVVGVGLLIALVLWATGGIGWTSYTPNSTRVMTIPAWPFAAGLFVILVVLVCIDLGARQAGAKAGQERASTR